MRIIKVLLVIIVSFFIFSCNDPASQIDRLVPPRGPSSLSGTATSGVGIELSWTDNANNEENMIVERNLDGAGYAEIASLAANTESYSDMSFFLGDDHSIAYRVYAHNNAGSSDPSNEVVLGYYAPVTVPEAPGSLSGTATSGVGIELSWTDNANNEENMIVERNLDGAGYAEIASLAANTESYSDESFSLADDHSIAYRVYARNSVGSSDPSNEVVLDYYAPVTVPEAPGSLSGTATSGVGIELSWTDNADNEENMIVERNLDGAGYTEIASLAANTESYSDMSFSLGDDHSIAYRVYARNSAGSSDPSNEVVLDYYAPVTVPEAPGSLSGTATSGVGIELSWTDNADNEENMIVERNLDGAGYAEIASLAANAESYSDMSFSLADDHSIAYRVYARNSAGDSDPSNEVTVDYFANSSSYLIIDHESVSEFDTLSPAQIAQAKKVLMVIAGESHVKAYWAGLELVQNLDPKYSVEVTVAGTAAANPDDSIRFERWYNDGSDWIDTMGEEDFFTNTEAQDEIVNGLQYIDNNFSGTILFGLGWCWDMTWHNGPTVEKDQAYDVGWAGSSEGGPDGDLPWGIDSGDEDITKNRVSLQTYLDAVDSYNSLGLGNTITIFTTGPVDNEKDTENGYQRWLKHEAIRNHVRTNGGILFDYADILSWDNGVQYISSWDGRSFPVGDPDLAPTGIEGHEGSHISEAGCLLLGKALWVLAARAGEWVP